MYKGVRARDCGCCLFLVVYYLRATLQSSSSNEREIRDDGLDFTSALKKGGGGLERYILSIIYSHGRTRTATFRVSRSVRDKIFGFFATRGMWLTVYQYGTYARCFHTLSRS